MSEVQAALERIYAAFADTPYPGDAFLLGSREGCEPHEEAGSFVGMHDWRAVEASHLDAHGDALSFFSEGAFRFFLPAYLAADLRGELRVADPLHHLTFGFGDTPAVAAGDRPLSAPTGRSALLNPRRYGAMTFQDYARFRCSVFTREEAEAIVAYLRCRRATATTAFERDEIDAALDRYWLERAGSAPTAEALRQHLAAEEALRRTDGGP